MDLMPSFRIHVPAILALAFALVVCVRTAMEQDRDLSARVVLTAAVSSAECGNGTKEIGEECDDGNEDNTDSCTTSCLKAACGDGYLWKGVEACDSALPFSCTAFCNKPVKAGASSASSVSSKLVGSCGDGVVGSDEECDMGSMNGSMYCTKTCKMPYCGDGVIGYGEECEPTKNQQGEYVTGTCGQSCTVPSCEGDECTGGCNWSFMSACGSQNVIAISSSSSSISSAAAAQTQTASFSSVTSVSSAASVATSSNASSVSSVTSSLISSAKSSSNSLSFVSPSSSSLKSAFSSSVGSEASNEFSSEESSSSSSEEISSDSSLSSTSELVGFVCGNGKREPKERCDDGALNSDTIPNACRTDCQLARCGDAVIDLGEQCDDGNEDASDGCAPGCVIAVCGNLVLELGEECDDGTKNSDILPNHCHKDCRLPSCGDGVLDRLFGEQCDDGANNSDILADHCRLDCSLPMCGDAVMDKGELCDDANEDVSDGCDACSVLRCPENTILSAGECIDPALPLCIGADCVIWAESGESTPWPLLVLLSVEGGLLSALLARLFLIRRFKS